MKRSGAVLALLLAACGKTNAAAIEELKPRYEPIRKSLASLFGHLGDAAVEVPLKGIVFDERNDAVGTVTFLMPEQLKDPDLSARRDDEAYVKRFDPIAGGDLLYCLNWTGPKNPMGEGAMSARNGDSLKAKCERAAAETKYVVVVETVSSVVPTLVSDGQFVGGSADLRVTVFDFATQRVASRFEVHGQPDQVVNVRVKPGESKAVEAALSVHSSMWVDARKKLFDGLKERGASITLR
ncbi:MAG: hypothetical protein JNM69_04615 [Archangium sp.]|nr:hypothetical protein [Archangium sp.]